MYFLKNDNSNRRTGFTLVEVLLIAAILSLISSIIVSSTRDSRKQARDAVRESDLRNIQAGMAVFFDNNDRYPHDYTELENTDLFATIPTDPDTDDKYPYATSTAGDNFDLCLAACMELPENGGGEKGICDEDSVNYSVNESYIDEPKCPDDQEYYISM